MESSSAFFTLLLLLLFATITAARPNPGENWQGTMKDKLMPEAIVVEGSKSSLSNKETDCHTSTDVRTNDHYVRNVKDIKKENGFAEDIEPRPNLSGYHDDAKENGIAEDIEPRPNFSGYHDDAKENGIAEDFEPRPNISVYHDDAGLQANIPFIKDFEPRDSASAYKD
ncbi:unnamed protein product [Ilex paraguariensis]|uniref:Organ specific protein n=1 Tax=Ilex paraguariensis TaxID=185542 RepID=A0ABC8RC74_9AQUA